MFGIERLQKRITELEKKCEELKKETLKNGTYSKFKPGDSIRCEGDNPKKTTAIVGEKTVRDFSLYTGLTNYVVGHEVTSFETGERVFIPSKLLNDWIKVDKENQPDTTSK